MPTKLDDDDDEDDGDEDLHQTCHREADALRYLVVVGVPLLHLRLPGGEVRAHEADGRAVEEETRRHRPLVARGAPEARLHLLDRDVAAPRNRGKRPRHRVVFAAALTSVSESLKKNF